MTNGVDNRPNLVVRIGIILLLVVVASIDKNPVVKLEAHLNLSPSPIERLFNTKSLFSGMTEGIHQLSKLEWRKSVNANILSPVISLMVLYSTLTWRFPRIKNKKDELLFFILVLILSFLVNTVNA